MFGHDAISWTPIKHLLMAENRVFHSTTPNNIYARDGGGIYAGDERYDVQYADKVGSLTGRQSASLSDAIADAISGVRSHSTTYIINSYWDSDKDVALADPNLSPTATVFNPDCGSENREDGADDTECGDCLSGFTEDATGVCVADTTNGDLADCGSENREDGADATECGDCLTGYTEDSNGDCVADTTNGDEDEGGTNWAMIVGGIAVIGIGAYFAFNK